MYDNNLNLKISLQDLRNLINLDKKDWINMSSTNCYAYALGLDIPEDEIINFAYVPGVLSNSDIFLPDHSLFTYDMLMNNIYCDFDVLGIEFREINPLDSIDYDEWKIALFISKYYEHLEDFHFLRQRKDGFWYHKDGYRGNVWQCFNNGLPTINPEECHFYRRTYNKCFSLKLKR